MNKTVAQRITASVALFVTMAIAAMLALPTRITTWSRDSRTKGEIVSNVIVIAGLAVLAVAVVAILGAKVYEKLEMIQ